MPITNNDVIATLNDLIEVCKDGQEGFRASAERVSEPDIKNMFYQYSQQRAQFAGELQAEVRSLGGEPETDGSVAGAVHRGWVNLKAALSSPDEYAVLAECESGEDTAYSSYRKALEKDLPANVVLVLIRQADAIKQSHDRVRSLRDRTKAARA